MTGQFGRPALYQCEWAQCPLTTRTKDGKVKADIQPEDHWQQECEQSWYCQQGHEFHHLHNECAKRLGLAK